MSLSDHTAAEADRAKRTSGLFAPLPDEAYEMAGATTSRAETVFWVIALATIAAIALLALLVYG